MLTETQKGAPSIEITENRERTVSFFEFWPSWIMYAPVAIQWVILAVRHRSLTLPFLANPSLQLSGMVGVAKSELMEQATGKATEAILVWKRFVVSEDEPCQQALQWIDRSGANGIPLPFVCKPDIGCRGSGVKLVHDVEELAAVIESYPQGTALLCQKLSRWRPEVGIFYVKEPSSGIASIVSMTTKLLPSVTGNGEDTLGQLIQKNPRAGQVIHLYRDRHQKNWDTIPREGEEVSLVFSASHCRGAVFSDARDHITPELNRAINEIMSHIPDFYYGRLDVKFPDIESLEKGEGLEIVEINGASAEAIHIWDKDTRFSDAIKTLLWQYRTLFRIGAYHRAKGMRPPRLSTFFRHWKLERDLAAHYPLTD